MVKDVYDSILFQFCRTGGCAAKLNPVDLNRIIGTLSIQQDPNLLTDFSGNEDAAVYKLTSDTAIVATVDVIAPPVAEPDIFGQIAAANALSDVYAMGSRPIICLSIMGIPEALSCSAAEGILAGANRKVQEAAALLVGGHTVRNDQLLFGLAAIGIVRPDEIWRNSDAKEGDVLVLTKPIGMGVLFSALRRGRLRTEDIMEAVQCATTLNKTAAELLSLFSIHAATDITGFGLLGHALEMAKASKVTYRIQCRTIPIMKGAIEMYEDGIGTTITAENIAYVREHLLLPQGIPHSTLQVLFDPQTNGGLLVALPVEQAPQVIQALHAAGFDRAEIIGTVTQFDRKNLILE